MEPAFLCALGAMLCYGAADLVYKRAAAAGINAPQFLMMQAWVFAPVMLGYALVRDELHFVPAAAWGAAAGFCVFVGFSNFALSLREGAVSVNAPIFRLSFTITAALAVLVLGEPAGAMKVAGLALALLATWLLLGGGSPAGASRRSLAQVLTATVFFGFAYFFYKLGVMHGALPATMVVSQAAVFFPLATGWGWRDRRGFAPPRAGWPYAVGAALLLAFAFMLLANGLVAGQASVVVPVAQMGFVVTAAAGMFWLGEAKSARKLAGLALAAGALICLAAS